MRTYSLILLVLILIGCGDAKAEPTDTPTLQSPADTPVPSTVVSSLPTAIPLPSTPEPISEGSLVLTNGTIIDGTGADPIVDGIVLPDELITRMVENDVFWAPTLELYHHITRDAQNGWDQKAIENLRRFVAGGGKVALGTDFAGYSAEFDLGMPMLEIESMQEVGMTPMQIIVAATNNAAHVCNLGSEIGTLEVGKKADILVVDGDPLTDIGALARTALVLRDGVIIRQ